MATEEDDSPELEESNLERIASDAAPAAKFWAAALDFIARGRAREEWSPAVRAGMGLVRFLMQAFFVQEPHEAVVRALERIEAARRESSALLERRQRAAWLVGAAAEWVTWRGDTLAKAIVDGVPLDDESVAGAVKKGLLELDPAKRDARGARGKLAGIEPAALARELAAFSLGARGRPRRPNGILAQVIFNYWQGALDTPTSADVRVRNGESELLDLIRHRLGDIRGEE